MTYDLIVIGSGLAGLYGSLLAARHGRVLLISKAEIADCNTYYAQGGIAAALLPPDSPALHYRDTLVAGDGLCEPRAVRALVEEGPARVLDLIRLGVPFDRHDGALDFTREGAHSANRVLHAGGDASGARIETTMVERVVASPNVEVREHHLLLDLILRAGRVAGVRVLDEARGEIREEFGRAVLLATGGAGQLFSHTTNPTVATGDGIAAAFRAGAAVADLEFVQFHPTALFKEGAPRFLISEAVRGEGGILRNAAGEAFVARYDPRGDLAPRDVVARAIVFEARRTGDGCAYLDVTHLGAGHVRRRFPTIARVCAEHGIDVGSEPIPVAPAAHYLMGGIFTDEHGATTLPGLYASGECACSGVHGANRLASNSLLETIVFSARAVEHHAGLGTGRTPSVEVRPEDELLPPVRLTVPEPDVNGVRGLDREALRERAWRQAGLTRDSADLRDLAAVAAASLRAAPVAPSRGAFERSNLALLTHLAAMAALRREESRGGHYRSDFPQADPTWRRHIVLRSGAPGTAWLSGVAGKSLAAVASLRG
jgi:L-aspartate oxidase